jgi:hypothetical protein
LLHPFRIRLMNANITYDDYISLNHHIVGIVKELAYLFAIIDVAMNLTETAVLKIVNRYISKRFGSEHPIIYRLISNFVFSYKLPVERRRPQESTGIRIKSEKYYKRLKTDLNAIITNYELLKRTTEDSAERDNILAQIADACVGILTKTLFSRTDPELVEALYTYLNTRHYNNQMLADMLGDDIDITDIIEANNSNENNNAAGENPLLMANAEMPNNHSNTPLQTMANRWQNGDAECYDPLMASYTPLKNVDNGETAILHVLNREGHRIKSYCFDKDTIDGLLGDADNVFYRCKSTVPSTATMITAAHIHPQRLRKIAMDVIMYVYENQAKKIQPGRTYIFVPTEEVVGRIASYRVVQGHSIVSREHCQNTYNSDYVYDVREIASASKEGGMGRTRRARGQAREPKRARKAKNTRRR